IVLYARRPVSLKPLELGLLRITRTSAGRRCAYNRGRKRLAEIGGYVGAVAAGIESGKHALAIRPLPEANVERRSHRSTLRRIRTAHRSGGSPGQFLRGESLYAGMVENAGQRGREAKAIRQHILCAGLAKFTPEKLIAVQDLPEDGLCGRRIDIAFLHGRSRRKPAACRDVVFEPQKVSRVVLLDQTVAVGAAEIEDVVRVLFE